MQTSEITLYLLYNELHSGIIYIKCVPAGGGQRVCRGPTGEHLSDFFQPMIANVYNLIVDGL